MSIHPFLVQPDFVELPPRIIIGPTVRSWRTYRQLSQLELAKAAEIRQSYLSLIETGRIGLPNAELVDRLADALRVSRMDLLSGREPPNQEAEGSSPRTSIPDRPPHPREVPLVPDPLPGPMDVAGRRNVRQLWDLLTTILGRLQQIEGVAASHGELWTAAEVRRLIDDSARLISHLDILESSETVEEMSLEMTTRAERDPDDEWVRDSVRFDRQRRK